ncbi:MAG TPA: ATP-binding protein [bacterium]|nr:ATP-binding protein [bacterium]
MAKNAPPKTPPRRPKATNPNAKIAALSARVAEMEHYVASLTRDSYDAILGIDRDGTIRSWNRGAWVIFGWEPEEIVGQSYHKMFPPEANAEADYTRMLKLLEKRGYANDEEAVRMTKDGRRVIVSVTRTAIKNARGEFAGFSAIMRDITERKKMESRLIHSERMSALGELAAILAHEIKNPLNSMVINLEVLRGHLAGIEPDARAKTEKYMRVLTDEMQRLNKVIRGFLDFAKPVALTLTDVSLNDVVRDLVDLVEPQARKNDVKIEVKLAEKIPLITGDAAQLKQALLNLVLNAIHAMPDGGALTLTTTALPQRFVRVTVADTGHGIAKDALAKVFDLFYTTKPEGSGLGLPTVQRIVSSHGGRIDVTSDVGRGTTFELVFPGG